MERSIKVLQWLATMALVVAGVMLLVKPMRAQETVRVDGSRHFILYDQRVKFDAAVEGFLK